jgi:hypothetical protein
MGRRAWMAGVLGVATVVLFAGPAEAQTEAIFPETCPQVFGHAPAGNLDKRTDPAPQSTVTPGRPVGVDLRWPNQVLAGERLHKVMECASVNGAAMPRPLAERQLVSAEGAMHLSAVVPSGLPAGSKLCSQSVLITKGPWGPIRRWSETTCYRVGAAAGTFRPMSRAPSSPAPPSPTPSTRTPDTLPLAPPLPPLPPRSATSPDTIPSPQLTAPPLPPLPPRQAAAAPTSQAGTTPPSRQLARTGGKTIVLFVLVFFGAVALGIGRMLQLATARGRAATVPIPRHLRESYRPNP